MPGPIVSPYFLPTQEIAKNQILGGLSRADLELVAPHLKPVKLTARDVLFRAEEQIEFCHFVVDGVISMTAEMKDGDMTEVGSDRP